MPILIYSYAATANTGLLAGIHFNLGLYRDTAAPVSSLITIIKTTLTVDCGGLKQPNQKITDSIN